MTSLVGLSQDLQNKEETCQEAKTKPTHTTVGSLEDR